MSINTNLLYVGLEGIYTFLAPFDTFYNLDSDILRIDALKSIGELISQNIDIQGTYFTPYGLTAVQYKDFLASNGLIVVLVDTGGSRYAVPSIFIQGLPDPNGEPYHMMGLNIVLGPLNTNYAMSTLVSTLTRIVNDLVGIPPAITPVELSKVKLIPTDQAVQMETIRQANISGFDGVVYYQNQLLIANQQIASLENFIKANFGTAQQAALIQLNTTATGVVTSTG
jgi:hypothetical protein